jgi:cyclopropane fatty-acyl-phospholipid synthase-like methyltransferase
MLGNKKILYRINLMLKIIEKSWNEFWAKYWRVDYRHSLPGIFEWDYKFVEFIECVCNISPGDRILDLGCGGGDQAKIFAKKGYEVVGIDMAPSLIEFARNQFKTEGLSGTFFTGDCSHIDFDNEFDACLFLEATFDIFGDNNEPKLLNKVNIALKNGGKIFINFLSPYQVQKHQKIWRKVKSGWELKEEWFDSETDTYRSKVILIQNNGTVVTPKFEIGYHANEAVRCYSIPEIKKKLVKANLSYINCYSSFDLNGQKSDAVKNIVVAEK